jgi:hypothetical protein
MVEIAYKAFYFRKWPDASKFGNLEMIGLEQYVRLGIYFGSFLGSGLGVFVPLFPLHSMTNSGTVNKLGKK